MIRMEKNSKKFGIRTPIGAVSVAGHPTVRNLDITRIRVDGGTQSRVEIDGTAVSDYADALREGVAFPPVTVFVEGGTLDKLDGTIWLADGFQRLEAHKLAGKKKIAANLSFGSVRDAILYSVGANEAHGVRRTRADKRKAVETLLSDPEWGTWSDRKIAEMCHVSHPLVAAVREEVGAVKSGISSSERTYTTKHGTVSTMDTSAIGKVAPETPDASGKDSPAPTINDNQAFREKAQESLPQAIKDREAHRQQAIASKKTVTPAQVFDELMTGSDRIAELEEANRALEAEIGDLREENKLYAEMKVQFAQGGFDKVVADKDEVIHLLRNQVADESAHKAAWAKKAKYWQDEALKLGWSRDVLIDIKTGEFIDG